VAGGLDFELRPKIVSFALVFALWFFSPGNIEPNFGSRFLSNFETFRQTWRSPAKGRTRWKWESGVPGMIFGVTPDQVRAFVDLSQALPARIIFGLRWTTSAPPWHRDHQDQSRFGPHQFRHCKNPFGPGQG